MKIFLTGLPCSGKSTLGRALAKKIDWPFFDNDIEIEKSTGLSIEKIFESHGEDFFRETESRVFRQLVSKTENAVIATGGGTVLNKDSRDLLKKEGFTVFIDRSVDCLLPYLKGSVHPLITTPNKIFELEKKRRKLYLEAAHWVLKNDSDVETGLCTLAEAVVPFFAKGLCVIGSPVSHSLSPAVHTAAFEKLGESIAYEKFSVGSNALPGFFAAMRLSKLSGCNVTIPHKQAAFALSGEQSKEARLFGSVNTVINRGGVLHGFSTDGEGLCLALKRCGYSLKNSRIVIAGTGGSAKAIAGKAICEGAAAICLLGRTKEKSLHFASGLKSGKTEIICGALNSPPRLSGFFMFINCTPLGMRSGEENFSDFRFLSLIEPNGICCDLTYNPLKTALLQAAEQAGLKTMNGLPVLIYQALLADELFLNRRLDIETLFEEICLKICEEGC